MDSEDTDLYTVWMTLRAAAEDAGACVTQLARDGIWWPFELRRGDVQLRGRLAAHGNLSIWQPEGDEVMSVRWKGKAHPDHRTAIEEVARVMPVVLDLLLAPEDDRHPLTLVDAEESRKIDWLSGSIHVLDTGPFAPGSMVFRSGEADSGAPVVNFWMTRKDSLHATSGWWLVGGTASRPGTVVGLLEHLADYHPSR